MIFVLQLVGHHCTLLFGFIICTLQLMLSLRCWWSNSSSVAALQGMYISPILYVLYGVNQLKGSRQLLLYLLFPEGEERGPTQGSSAPQLGLVKSSYWTEGWLTRGAIRTHVITGQRCEYMFLQPRHTRAWCVCVLYLSFWEEKL